MPVDNDNRLRKVINMASTDKHGTELLLSLKHILSHRR